MPFFIHPQSYQPQPAFNPFLDLLREVNRDSCQPKQRPVKTFTPEFDIVESESAYELCGELAGVEQKDVNIEFTDRQTLTISGRRERQPSSIVTSSAPSTPTEEAAPASHKATVEDDFEEINASDSDAATTTSTAQNTEAAVATEKVEEKKPEAPKTRYWIAERGVGQFSRSFEFQEGINRQGVQASLKNGVLSVVVPKKPFENRKVEIN